MSYHATIRGERFVFADLRTLFARANEQKSGDQLAGLAAHSERERVAAKLATPGCNDFMRVPCADDVMLNYQPTSYHDAVGVRQLLNLRPAPEFAAWLEAQGVIRGERLGSDAERLQLLRGVSGLLEG
jgi:ethanolamine ammonia-lyase large subunit